MNVQIRVARHPGSAQGDGMRVILAVILMMCTALASAAPVSVEGVRLWGAPDHTRIVLDVSASVKHSLFTLEKPDRVVIDLQDAKLNTPLSSLQLPSGVLKRVRSGERNHGHDLRLVLDIDRNARPKSFMLGPTKDYGYRLVIDLNHPAQANVKAETPIKTVKTQPEAPRDLVIAIDAGHGGEDPGARGRRGTREKEVVLAIAKRLAELVEKEPGMRPVLIRKGDYYLGLKKRTELARAQKADLFVSIHADAFADHRARGASVYVLSQRGASTEAGRWLADSENASDLIGGVSLDDKDDVLASVLLDLSQSATTEASLDVAGRVLSELKGLGRVHKPQVEQAAFRVLKSPDIPSILVETAFISNPEEERKLRDPAHQQHLAMAILNGVRGYFASNPPPGTRMAMIQRHVIKPGETLSHIANRYSVSVADLRNLNKLKNDQVRTGQTLRIPASSDS